MDKQSIVLAVDIETEPGTDSSELQALIRQMARDNSAWGQERIAVAARGIQSRWITALPAI
jgi:hypothetical protein